ncbi:hypothetical protein BDV37DRAFT_252945 [Aspergillus pseudonomiae]|uniref:Uncharacterized protein n=1 Tax=Aspergillus pseudonomiae TaxID=1506151 RepID=A0A5N7D790_9EURO|nr:uncharacterized protein BDV37DRAFT_252945 [Aspergillus pseudonomiae]KAE8402149.1 hypothetical protein BDV37DRAFT_252945 [Aspergillus pseudonomiae]
MYIATRTYMSIAINYDYLMNPELICALADYFFSTHACVKYNNLVFSKKIPRRVQIYQEHHPNGQQCKGPTNSSDQSIAPSIETLSQSSDEYLRRLTPEHRSAPRQFLYQLARGSKDEKN